MSEPVKPVRRYDASRRQEQARENRRRIIDAAGALFREHGYAGTAMPDVARLAGVSVQTVYKVFANKSTLLKAVFDVTVAGDDEEVPMADRDVIARVQAEPDAARKIELYFAHFASLMPAVGPLQLVARAAAGVDAAGAAVWRQMCAERLTAMTYFAADLTATGQVRPGFGPDEVRDVLWTYHGPELYDLLCVERGWNVPRYERFLREALIAAVLTSG